MTNANPDINPEKIQRVEAGLRHTDLSESALPTVPLVRAADTSIEPVPNLYKHLVLLRDESDTVRVNFSAALAIKPPQLEKALPAIRTALLTEENHEVILNLLEAVSAPDLKPHGAAIVPALTYLLSDDRESVRKRAIDALATFGESSAGALPPLYSMYEIGKRDSRKHLRTAIDKIDPAAFDRLTDFIDALDARKAAVKVEELTGMRSSQTATYQDVRSAIQTMHMDRSTSVMRKAAQVVAKHVTSLSDAEKQAVLPSLMLGLTLTESYAPFVPIKQQVLTALSRMGPMAEVAVPVLERMAEASSAQIRPLAAVALVSVSPESLPAGIRAIGRGLEHPRAEVREMNCKAMARILPLAGKPLAREAVSAMLACLDDPSAEVRLEAVRALGAATAGSALALSGLTTVLNQDEDPFVKIAACRSIEWLKPNLRAGDIERAVGVLGFAATDPDELVAGEAKKSQEGFLQA